MQMSVRTTDNPSQFGRLKHSRIVQILAIYDAVGGITPFTVAQIEKTTGRSLPPSVISTLKQEKCILEHAVIENCKWRKPTRVWILHPAIEECIHLYKWRDRIEANTCLA